MVETTSDAEQAQNLLDETDDLSTVELTLKLAQLDISANDQGDTLVKIEVDGEHFEMTDHALVHTASILGIPANYALKCPPGILAPQVQYWLDQLSDRKKVRLVIAEEKVEGVTSPNFIPTRSKQLYELLTNIGDLVWLEHEFIFTRILIEKGRIQVDGNDIVLGFNVLSSQTNDVHTEIQPCIVRHDSLRLVTPVLHENDGRPTVRFRKDDGDIESWVDEQTSTIEGTFGELEKHINLVRSQKLSVAQVEQALNAQKLHVPGPLRELVDEAFAEDPDATIWGIAGAVARAALDIEKHPPTHRLQGERRAGSLVISDDCDTCSRPLHD